MIERRGFFLARIEAETKRPMHVESNIYDQNLVPENFNEFVKWRLLERIAGVRE